MNELAQRTVLALVPENNAHFWNIQVTIRQTTELLFRIGEFIPKNVQKRKARPKRSIANPGDDHEVGLWIDYDLLRRHQSRSQETIIHDPLTSTNNRYLKLADLALGVNKSAKKKSKAAASGQD